MGGFGALVCGHICVADTEGNAGKDCWTSFVNEEIRMISVR